MISDDVLYGILYLLIKFYSKNLAFMKIVMMENASMFISEQIYMY